MKHIFLAAAMLCTLFSCAPAGSQAGADFEELLVSRRSVRDFDASRSISEAEVRTIIEASQQAPSWANTQTTRYYVAISSEKADAVRELIGERNKQNTAGAPVFALSTFVKGQAGYFRGSAANELGDVWGVYDNGLNNAYFVLKARAMGFDTLIIGGRDAEGLRSLFSVPAEECITAVIALGYRASEPRQPVHKPVEEIVKFF